MSENLIKEKKLTSKEVNEAAVHKFDKGSVLSVMLKLALPIIIMMLFTSAYALIDSMMAARLVHYGTSTVTGNELTGGTAIGIIMPLIGIFNSLALFHTIGAGLAYSRFSAKGDYVKANQCFDEAVTMSFVSGAIILAITALIGIPYVKFISGNWYGSGNPIWQAHTHQMVMQSYEYMLTLTLAFIPLGLTQLMMRVARTEGSSLVSLIPITSLPINILLDWVFMGPAKLGLAGAGLATLIASTLNVLMFVGVLLSLGHKGKTHIRISVKEMKLTKPIVILLLSFGVSSLMRTILDNASLMVLASSISHLGMNVSDTTGATGPLASSDWQDAWTAISRSLNMVTMISLGVAQSISMLVAYYRGKHDNSRMKDTLKYGLISVAVMQVLASALMFGIEPFIFKGFGITSFTYSSLYSIAFAFSVIMAGILAFQFIPIMFYSGLNKPKLALRHSLTLNAIVILFYVIAYFGIYVPIKDEYTAQIVFFAMIPTANLVAVGVIYVFFVNTYKNYFAITK